MDQSINFFKNMGDSVSWQFVVILGKFSPVLHTCMERTLFTGALSSTFPVEISPFFASPHHNFSAFTTFTWHMCVP